MIETKLDYSIKGSISFMQTNLLSIGRQRGCMNGQEIRAKKYCLSYNLSLILILLSLIIK